MKDRTVVSSVLFPAFASRIALPDQRYTTLPFAVAVVYVLTVIVILIEAARLSRRAT